MVEFITTLSFDLVYTSLPFAFIQVIAIKIFSYYYKKRYIAQGNRAKGKIFKYFSTTFLTDITAKAYLAKLTKDKSLVRSENKLKMR